MRSTSGAWGDRLIFAAPPFDRSYAPGISSSSDPDYRFSLANERTFLAWIRTALALVAGGIAAAKALDFQHDVWRWVIAGPPILGGALLALEARRRWAIYEDAMRRGRPLPVGRGVSVIGLAICVYAVIALIAAVLDM